jgi:hypothetical protein
MSLAGSSIKPDAVQSAPGTSLAARLAGGGLGRWLPEVVLLLVTTAAGLWAAGRWVDPCSDAAYSWSGAYRVSQGERLYRDIYLPYTPLSPLLLGAAARFFGASARFYLWAAWIPAVAAGLLLVRAARQHLTTIERLALVGVALATSLFVDGPGRLVFAYNAAAPEALAFALGALLLVSPGRTPALARALWAGCLAGLAFDSKQEIGVAAVLSLGAAALAGLDRPWVWLAGVAGGFLAAMLPAAVYVFASAPLLSLRQDSHVWPLAPPPPTTMHLMRLVSGLQDPGWFRSTVTTIWSDLGRVAILALVSLLFARDRRRAVCLRVGGLLLLLGVWWLWKGRHWPPAVSSLSLSMTVAFAVALWAFFSQGLEGRPFLVSFALFAGLAAARNAFGARPTSHYAGPAHLAAALTTTLFLLVVAPRLLLGRGSSASIFRTVAAALLLAVSGWQTIRGIASLRAPGHVPVETDRGRVFVDPGHAEVLNVFSREARAGNSVLILPETYALDALFDVRNPSPLVQALPGWLVPDVERRLIQRMESSPPELVVIFKRRYREFGSAPFGVGYGHLLSAWCDAHYRVIAAFPEGRVLRRR